MLCERSFCKGVYVANFVASLSLSGCWVHCSGPSPFQGDQRRLENSITGPGRTPAGSLNPKP